MEAVGSRLGRASSRYGTSASAAVFSGPVRKWKRKWVHVSLNNHKLSDGQKNNTHNSSSNSNNNNNSRLLLCRWTPLSSATAEEEAEVAAPRRRFRYAPVVVLEERKKAAKKVEPDGSTTGTDLFGSWKTSKSDELNEDEALKKESQDPDRTHLDLGLSLKDNNSDPDSDGQVKKANSGGFWAVG